MSLRFPIYLAVLSVTAAVLTGCRSRSAVESETVPEDVMTTAQELFASHGVRLSLRDGWLVGRDDFPSVRATIENRRREGDMVSQRLDVEIRLGPDRSIVESFGDSGPGSEEATSRSLQNFAQSDFHVLLSALWDQHDDEQVTWEAWEIGAMRWELFIGGLVGKVVVGNVEPPFREEFLPTVEAQVRARELSPEMHWIRVFYANIDQERQVAEVLFDNEPWPSAERAISQIDWPKEEHYYSQRLFLIMKPAE